MLWNRIVPTSFLLLVSLSCAATAQDSAVRDSRRERDRQAIEKVTQTMLQAFEKRDAAAMAGSWTTEGEFIRNDAEPVRGRAEIERVFVEYFRQLEGKPRLKVQSDSLRFLSADVAVGEATLRLEDDQGRVLAACRQETLLARKGGEWKVALVREWDHDLRLDQGLNDLEWLLGTWHASTKDRTVTISYEWDEHRAFLRGRYTVRTGDKLESGTELIGWDPALGVIRSWLFQSDGAFADGTWIRDGKKWTINVHGVRADGSRLAANIIYLQVDRNTIAWQAVNQLVDGVPVEDTPPIRVARQSATP